MIYLESFRHFAQEWIEIQHPHDDRPWPWDRTSKLYCINLYPISAGQVEKMPPPFISILINGINDGPRIIGNDQCLYRHYFQQSSFKLPRRYLYDPLNRGDKSLSTNRYSFTSDGYGTMACDWRGEDLRLIKELAHRKHIRRSIYNSDEFGMIRTRLDELETASQTEIHTAENLFDCTKEVQDRTSYSPELMVIQVPIVGILKAVKKSREYRIINGALVMCNDPVRLSIPEEPSAQQYRKSMIPFEELNRASLGDTMGQGNIAKAVVYVAVEGNCGTFTIQEFTPHCTLESAAGDTYVRVLNHHFAIRPELSRVRHGKLEVRLGHTIEEGLVPLTKANERLYTKRSEKLFHRADMPRGFIKSPGGRSVTAQLQPEL